MPNVEQLLEYARERAREARREANRARTVAEESEWTHAAALWEAKVAAYEVELAKKPH